MKKSTCLRIVFYVTGLLTLALGIILNTKSGLGVSPIISVSYSISTIWKLNFGNMTFVLYAIFVVVEMILHSIRYWKLAHQEESIRQRSVKKTWGMVILMDALQLPLSLVFTRFMNLFSNLIPNPGDKFIWKLLVLLLGIMLTGIGAAMSLDMRIIPNPGDGIVQAIADCVGKPVGLTKNCFDLFNICLTISVSFIFVHHLVGVGLGTVISVLGVGRVIAFFNHLFLDKMKKITDL